MLNKKQVLEKCEVTKAMANTIIKLAKKASDADEQLGNIIEYYTTIFIARRGNIASIEDFGYNKLLFDAIGRFLQQRKIAVIDSNSISLIDKNVSLSLKTKFKETFMFSVVNGLFSTLGNLDLSLEWNSEPTHPIINELNRDPYVVSKIVLLLDFINKYAKISENSRILLIANNFSLFPLLFERAFQQSYDLLVFKESLSIVYSALLSDLLNQIYVGNQPKNINIKTNYDFVFSFLPFSFLPFQVEYFLQWIPTVLSGKFIFYQIFSSSRKNCYLDILFSFFEDYRPLTERDLIRNIERFSLKWSREKLFFDVFF
ncbi:MAG: hypothetical protein ACP6IU_00830 [Candidatus Asgardarchaeia archaeon]